MELGSSSYAGSPTPTPQPAGGINNCTDVVTVSISDLTPKKSSKCTIRARVTNKSHIKMYRNAKGEGNMFSMDLIDASGEIQMTGFNNAVVKFYDKFQINNVYFIKNFQIQPSNKQWTSFEHEYNLNFGKDTQVDHCLGETLDVPTLTFNFVDIASIAALDNNCVIDCIGICKRRGDLHTITHQASGKELTKRDIYLVDETNREIQLSLLAERALDFQNDSNPVVAIKGARVEDYSGPGKRLSTVKSSILLINPDIPKTHILREWFDNEGEQAECRSLFVEPDVAGCTTWKLLSEVNTMEPVDTYKGDYFMSKVTVTSIRRDHAAYKACPSATCNKKVFSLRNGRFRCPRCRGTFKDFKWRLMITVNFADYSDEIWATCFQASSETILGQTAHTIGPLQKDPPEAFDAIIKERVWNSYIVKLRARMETYNNETEMKVMVLDVQKLNFVEYAKKLLAEIKGAVAP